MNTEKSLLISLWLFVGKFFIGLIIGIILGVGAFGLIQSLSNARELIAQSVEAGDTVSIDPVVRFVFLLIGVVVTIVGNLFVGAALNILFGSVYYDMTQIVVKPLVLNILLLVAFAPLYFLVPDDMASLYFVTVMHISLSIFATCIIIEMIGTPHYGAVHVVGYTLGGALLLMIIYLLQQNMQRSETQYMILLGMPVITYLTLFIVHGLRSRLYISLTDGGSDFLFTPMLEEITVEEEEEINIDI